MRAVGVEMASADEIASEDDTVVVDEFADDADHAYESRLPSVESCGSGVAGLGDGFRAGDLAECARFVCGGGGGGDWPGRAWRVTWSTFAVVWGVNGGLFGSRPESRLGISSRRTVLDVGLSWVDTRERPSNSAAVALTDPPDTLTLV